MARLPKERGGRRRRRCWAALALLVGVPAALALSALYHLDTPLGHRVVAELLDREVSALIRGRLVVGGVERARLDDIVVRDAVLFDPHGRPVITADRITLAIDPLAALRGTLRFSKAHLSTGDLHLLPGDADLPSFVDALEPSGPPSPPNAAPGLHAIVDDMRLRDLRIHGQALGLSGLRIEHTNVHMGMEFGAAMDLAFYGATGDIRGPFPFPSQLDAVVGHVYDDARGVRLHVRVHRDEEHARANVRYAPRGLHGPRPVPADTPYDLDLLIHADPVRAQTVRELGFTWAESLLGQARGFVRLDGPIDALRLRAQLSTDGGEVRLRGVLPVDGAFVVDARSPGLDVARVLSGLPDVHVGGEVTLRGVAADLTPTGATSPSPSPASAVTHIETKLGAFAYQGFTIPPTHMRGAFDDEGLRVESLDATGGRMRFHASGRLSDSGALTASARGYVPRLSRDSNFARWFDRRARGSLRFDVRLQWRPRGRVVVRGSGAVTEVTLGAVSARRLAVKGSVRGSPAAPSVDLDLAAEGLTLDGYTLGDGDARVVGGPSRYRVKLATRGRVPEPGGAGAVSKHAHRHVLVDATVGVRGDRYTLDASRVELGVDHLTWRGAVEGVTLRFGDALQIDRARLTCGAQRLDLGGRMSLRTRATRGADAITLDVQQLDLATLRTLFPELSAIPAGLAGFADAHITLGGHLLSAPRVGAEGVVRDGAVGSVSHAGVTYRVAYAPGSLELDGQLDLGARGGASIHATGVLDRRAPSIAAALRGGVYTADLRAAGLDLALAKDRWDAARFPLPTGQVSGSLHVTGPLDSMAFKGALSVPKLGLQGVEPIGAHARFSYAYGTLNATVATADDRGPLIDGEVSLLVDLGTLLADPSAAVEALGISPWRVSLRLAPRKLDWIGGKLAAKLPVPLSDLRVGASLVLSGGALETRGDLDVAFDWAGKLTDDLCAQDASPRATLHASLAGGETTASLVGMTGTRQIFSVAASARTPLEQWLTSAHIVAPPVTHLVATLPPSQAESLPLLCHYASGPIQGRLVLDGLFGATPSAKLVVASTGLRLRRVARARRHQTRAAIVEAPAAGLLVQADLSSTTATGELRASWPGGAKGNLFVHAPIQWDASHLVPALAEAGAFDAKLVAHEMPLAAALAWLSSAVEAKGTIDGEVSANGTVEAPNLAGRLRLTGASVTLPTVGQRLQRAGATLVFEGDTLLVPDVAGQRLSVWDGDGHVVASGTLQLDALRPASATVTLAATRFPVREEGSIVARLTGTMRGAAKFGPTGMKSQVEVERLDVALPEQSATTPIDLAPNPDVHVLGEAGAPPPVASGKPVVVRLVASRPPIDIHRDDFAAKVEAQLELTYREPDLRVRGDARIVQGYFEVFGKRFNVEQGSLLFQGGEQLDPEVQLVASHKLTGSGEVTVTASGTLSNPRILFGTSSGEAATQAEIIQLLITGQSHQGRAEVDPDEASRQASGFLAGVVGGVLTVALREQFGRFVPNISLEQTETSGTRIRAGFNVNQLIPKWLRKVVRGMYVEGFFTAAGAEDERSVAGESQPGGGFLVELQFPFNLIATGQFARANSSTWSIDLTWEP